MVVYIYFKDTFPIFCQDVYQWCGSDCNRFERLKASQLAIDIRDNERNGRAKLIMVEDGAEPDALTKVSERFKLDFSCNNSHSNNIWITQQCG